MKNELKITDEIKTEIENIIRNPVYDGKTKDEIQEIFENRQLTKIQMKKKGIVPPSRIKTRRNEKRQLVVEYLESLTIGQFEEIRNRPRSEKAEYAWANGVRTIAGYFIDKNGRVPSLDEFLDFHREFREGLIRKNPESRGHHEKRLEQYANDNDRVLVELGKIVFKNDEK